MVQEGIMSRTPSTSTQEIQMDMFDHHGSHAQVRERDTRQLHATSGIQNTNRRPLFTNNWVKNTDFVYGED